MPAFLKDVDLRVSAILFALSFGVYWVTSSPTINFWDCGEFVATSHTLGIPHQPGTPLYVLVGRVFSILPLFGLAVAKKINLMSAFFGALAVSFIYLSAVRLMCSWRDEKAEPTPDWLKRVGAACGALFLAFSTTFWNNAIEAEVYSLAGFFLAVTTYLSIRWYETENHAKGAALMLFIVYLMGMSVGFHLGSVLVFPGVLVLVAMVAVEEKRPLLFVDNWIVGLFVAAFVLTTMAMPSGFVLTLFAVALLAAVWRMITWGTTRESEGSGYFPLAGILLFALGISVHLLMLIRAGQDPMINQSQPETFDTLMSVLKREQYPPKPMNVRQAEWAWQFGHLWGSVEWQAGTSLAGSKVIGYLQQFNFLPRGWFDFGAFRLGHWLNVGLPMTLWLFGMVTQAFNGRKLFVSIFTSLLINSVGLLIVLNFNDHEVRDRDYFYFGFYLFLALFIALGVGSLLRLAWLSLRDGMAAKKVLVPVAVVAILAPSIPVIGAPMGHDKWYEHDRSRNDIARNYAYNILAGLPENAIIFTNGDNDTFPLWYLQEVEGLRRDVRVVNLSLINLPWYLKQLRDYEPSVPLQWTDAQIEGDEWIRYFDWRTKLLPQELPNGKVVWVRDMAVWQIIENAGPDRPCYYAVTVPNENIGWWVQYLDMEGLVYRVSDTATEDERPEFDTEKIWHNFTQVYDFSGVTVDGTFEGEPDTGIYRDHNSRHLLNNYPAALCRIGFQSTVDGDYDRALEAAEAAYRFNPSFPVVADLLPMIYLQARRIREGLAAAERIEPNLQPADRNNMMESVADALMTLREYDAAIQFATERIELEPMEPRWPQLLFRAYYAQGQDDLAIKALEAYVERSGDQEAARELPIIREELRREAEAAPRQGPDSSQVETP